MKKIGIVFLVASVMLCLAGINKAQAITLDLSTVSSGEINGAIFSTFDASKAGRGVFPAFLATQNQATLGGTINLGYNSDNRPVQYDETSAAPHNHSLLLSDLGVYTDPSGDTFYSFTLDADQQANPGGSAYIYLDYLQIWQTNDPSLTGYNLNTYAFDSGATKVYDLDGAGDSQVIIDYLASSGGSGWADMIVDIPTSVFSASFSNVVLFAQFSNDNDGPQEWAYLAGSQPVPEPGTIVLMGLGLVGLAGVGRKRLFKK